MKMDRSWTRMFLVLVSIGIVAVAHLETVRKMVAMWGEEHHTQSYLIPPIFLYLLWTERQRLGRAPEGARWIGVVALLLLTGVWIVAQAVSIQLGVFVSVVLMASAVAIALIGWPAYRVAWFPLAFLLASIPAGSEFIPALMSFTAEISEVLLRLTGVAFYRERMLFHLPGGSFEVAEVCAGLRYISAAVTVALLFCYMNFRSPLRWAIFISATVAAFIFANGLRAAVTMWVSSETPLHDFTGPAHVWMGRILFLLVILVMFWAGRRFSDIPHDEATAVPAAPVGAGATSLPVSATVAVVAVAVLFVGPAAYGSRQVLDGSSVAALVMPPVPACNGPSEWPARWEPKFAGADAVVKAGYQCGDVALGTYVATYFSQRQGKELVSEMNRVLPPGFDKVAVRDVGAFESKSGATVEVNTRRFGNEEMQGVLWYWYSVDGTPERAWWREKLREVAAALLMQSPPASVHVVVVVGRPDQEKALHDYVEQAARELWAAGAPGADADG